MGVCEHLALPRCSLPPWCRHLSPQSAAHVAERGCHPPLVLVHHIYALTIHVTVFILLQGTCVDGDTTMMVTELMDTDLYRALQVRTGVLFAARRVKTYPFCQNFVAGVQTHGPTAPGPPCRRSPTLPSPDCLDSHTPTLLPAVPARVVVQARLHSLAHGSILSAFLPIAVPARVVVQARPGHCSGCGPRPQLPPQVQHHPL